MKKTAIFLCLLLLGVVATAQLIPVQNNGNGVSGTWNILVIPVEFNNWAHNQPISPTYNPYFAPVEISDLSQRYNTYAKDYYYMTSRGQVNVNFHVFPQWLNMGNMTTYAGSAFAPTSLLTNSINAYNNNYQNHPGWQHESYYDKTIIAFAGPVYQDEWDHEWTGTVWSVNQFIWAIAYLAGDNGKANCISIYSGVGVITHEMGHALFNLKDKDVSSRIPNYRYQLMGAGSWNGCDAFNPFGYQNTDKYKNVVPSPIEPWIRVNLGWERQPLQFSTGTQESRLLLAPVTDISLVGNAQTYRNLIAISTGNSYYLLENRQHSINLSSSQNVDWNLPNMQSWDLALPSEGILVWKITDGWRSSYGSDSGYSSISQLWSEVIDTNPVTTTLPVSYRYRYIDGQDNSIGGRTSAFNDVSGYNILGKYDAPIALGESFTLPGTSIVLTYEQVFPDGSVFVRINNVNQSIQDAPPDYAEAELNVTPESIEAELVANQQSSHVILVANSGEEGSVLNYSISVSETVRSQVSNGKGQGSSRNEFVTIGNGTDYYPRPFDAWNARGRSVTLLTSTEIGRTGLITHLGWSVRNARSYNLPIKIWIKPTTITSVSTSTWNTDGATQVFNSSVAFNATGWWSIDIADYTYTGANLLVLTEANYGGNGTASTVQFHCVSNATAMHAWNRDSGSYTVDARRPNIRLFFAPTYTLSILQPNGGEVYRVGEAREILWESTGAVNNVNLELSTDNGNTWQAVAQNQADGGSYAWAVPDAVSPNCRIRISMTGNPAVHAISAASFEILPWQPGFQITSPIAGARWAIGQSYQITWNTVGDFPIIAIDLSRDDGIHWSTIQQEGSNTGSFTWQVDVQRSAYCRIRVRSVTNPNISEDSSLFEIYQPFDWINLNSGGGTLLQNEQDQILVHINTQNMIPDTYQANIVVSTSGEEVIIPVTLVVSGAINPPSPQNLQISVSGDLVQLVWDPIPNVTFRIYAADHPGGDFLFMDSTATNTWSSPLFGEAKFFKVTAVN